MSQLTNFLANLSINDPAVWLAVAAGIVVVFVFLLLGRHKRRLRPIIASETLSDDGLNSQDAWMPAKMRADERRRSTRRGGVPTPVHFADPKKPKKIFEGFVLDRSTGGVRLASEKPFPAGSLLQIRPSAAAPENPWITLIVRNCRECGDYFELGCQFQEELPWHLLLMFG